MSASSQSRGRLLVLGALIAVLIGAFIILRPCLWVKNKTAKVIVDGRLSEDIQLFHGSDDRLLFYLRAEPKHPYYFTPHNGVLQCQPGDFTVLKIIAFSPHLSSQCAKVAPTAVIEQQSLKFEKGGHTIVVSWQPAPR